MTDEQASAYATFCIIEFTTSEARMKGDASPFRERFTGPVVRDLGIERD